jgi:hypothetical protein
MKTYSLSERDCSNCNLGLTKTDKEKNELFFKIIDAYGIVAIDNSDEYSYEYYKESDVQYDEDEYYNFMETVGNFYMCCFKNVSDNNYAELCNQCEHPSYRFNSVIEHFKDINDMLYDDKIYNLTEKNTDCSDCSKIGTTKCTNLLFWLRDYLNQKEQKVHLQIQRCSDYEHSSQTTSQTYDSYDYDSYAYIDYF